MGESGLVAQKISATFASTGTPSFFLHPAEALHGDLGIVASDDTALLLSDGGGTRRIIPASASLLRMGIPCGAIAGRADSHLAQAARWRFLSPLPQAKDAPPSRPHGERDPPAGLGRHAAAAARIVYSGFTLEGSRPSIRREAWGRACSMPGTSCTATIRRLPPEAPLVDVLSRSPRGGWA